MSSEGSTEWKFNATLRISVLSDKTFMFSQRVYLSYCTQRFHASLCHAYGVSSYILTVTMIYQRTHNAILSKCLMSLMSGWETASVNNCFSAVPYK